MKLYANLLALCVLYPNVWETSAFVNVPRSAAFKSSSLYSTSTVTYTPTIRSTTATPSQTIPSPSKFQSGRDRDIDSIWYQSKPLTVQGGTLKTWTFESPAIERLQVTLKTKGSPLDSDVDL